jgi:GNAT superfamily N-acetyltransferase
MRVREVDLGATYDLRRRVLRNGTPTQDVTMAGDAVAGTFHLGVEDDNGAVVAVATFVPSDAGVQLRGMAVEPALQGSGLGRMLLDAAVERLRSAGVGRLWANARDDAMPFYDRLGWRVCGHGFVDGPTGLPHHQMELEL